ncbi:uncharacterized [Tachysurus ichikawai]
MCNESRDKSRPPDRGKCSPHGCAMCQCNSQHKVRSSRLSQAGWWHVLARAALIAVSASLFPVMCAFPTPLITSWLLTRAVLHYSHSLDELFGEIFQPLWHSPTCSAESGGLKAELKAELHCCYPLRGDDQVCTSAPGADIRPGFLRPGGLKAYPLPFSSSSPSCSFTAPYRFFRLPVGKSLLSSL